MAFAGTAACASPAVGEAAPEFSLPDQSNTTHNLADYRGKWVVVYFYPKDGTSSCTEEACSFRDSLDRFKSMGAEVLGISLDDVESHALFAEKNKLNFPILADTSGATAQSYGSYWEFGPLRVVRRQTFLIDPEGKVAKVYHKVYTDSHTGQVIKDLQALQTASN